MNFKPLFALVLLFLGGLHVNAQRCKYLVDEKDPITDDVIRTIKNRITGPITGVSPYYYFYYIRNGSSHTFKVEVADYGKLTHSIPEKSELIIRLEDGALIRVFASKEAKPQPIKEYGEELTAFEIAYEISEEDMKKIEQSGIIFIRALDFKNSFSDQKVPKPVTEQSQFNAACIFK